MKNERIKDCFPIIRNGASVKQDKATGGIPITRIESIYESNLDLERLGYAGINDESLSGFYLEEGDILMSHINSVSHLGKVAIYEKRKEKIIHGMNLLCLKANKNIVFPKYAFYYFRSPIFISSLKRITKKSVNQASFNISNFKNLLFPLQKIEDQIKIANILGNVEGLIKQRKESIDLLDVYLKSTFLKMFGTFKTPKYQTEPLENFSIKITDGTHLSPTFTSTGVPFLLVSNIVNNEIKYLTKKFISEEQYLELNKRTPIEIGDILITSVGSYGNPALVKTITKFAFQRHIAFVKPDKRKINNVYLFEALKSVFVKNQIEKVVRGVAQKTLNLNELRKLEIPNSPTMLQNEFETIVEKIDVIKMYHQKSLQELENLFASLSQKAFKGELDLSSMDKITKPKNITIKKQLNELEV